MLHVKRGDTLSFLVIGVIDEIITTISRLDQLIGIKSNSIYQGNIIIFMLNLSSIVVIWLPHVVIERVLSGGIRNCFHLVLAVHEPNGIFDLGNATLKPVWILLFVDVIAFSGLSNHLQGLFFPIVVSSGWNPMGRCFHTSHSVQI